MFALREILSQLPSDGATRWIKVENVSSPMSSADVTNLFPDAIGWHFTSHILRTDYVVCFPNESLARIAMGKVEGLLFLGEKLRFSYVEEGDEYKCPVSMRVTGASPPLFFLPPEVSYDSRLAEADRIISSICTTHPSNQKWVDGR
ncbi:hypothetical protein DQ04_10181000 [Trypanosoma grayi]|uniref:hypothetical protein n=1 Tax=Trypanosoma grayi TaxID=71804 RepID=UPI0004F4321F|nr:hypothetical protein DQ04_10181000 [Trypanosoma grayi]KEG07320.1 hypothetical protein DQ04_10181000 [Trypanosoma grayi]